MTELIMDNLLLWWVTVIDIPALTGLFIVVWKLRQDMEREIDDTHRLLEARHAQLRESLAAYKLEVAKSYASSGEVRDLEMRLVAHLLRIESKLDKTALRAAELTNRE